MTLFCQSSVASEDTILRGPANHSKRKGCCNEGDGFTVIFCCFSVLTAAITVALVIQLQLGHPEVTPHGAVASNSNECSLAGKDILRDGGSSVDIAIATILCLSVVHPHIVGPGGGGVMLVHDHKANSTVVIDFMPAVPTNHQLPNHLNTVGTQEIKSIGIPGFLHGLHHAHKKFGKLHWKQLFERAIDLAMNGFNISPSLADASASLSNQFSKDGRQVSYFKELFFPGNVPLKEGEFMKRENYGEFLTLASEKGPAVMWPTTFADEIFGTLKEAGSLIAYDDIQDYKVLEHPCIHTSIMNNTIFTAPGPFGGPQLLLGLHLLHFANMTKKDSEGLLYHRFINVDRLSYTKMLSIASKNETFWNSLKDEQIQKLGQNSSIDGDILSFDQTLPHIQDPASSEVAIIDTFDQYVSAVVGLGTRFGSRLMTKHGVLFNNLVPDSLAHFDHNHNGNINTDVITESPENISPEDVLEIHKIVKKQDPVTDEQDDKDRVKKRADSKTPTFGNKRVLNPYTPIIVTDSNHVCGRRAVLSSGSVRAAMQVVAHLIFKDRSLPEAIEEPRVMTIPPSPLVYLDDKVPYLKRLQSSTRQYLNSRGVEFANLPSPIPSVNGVSKYRDDLVSQSDARGGGFAHRLDVKRNQN